MKRNQIGSGLLACACAALAFTVTAEAQNNRTFVGTGGLDTNNCSPTAYCRTLARALSVTNAGGEVVITDSGGYGPTTINQPVTISAVSASITATSGNALIIDTTGDVTISGLNLFGMGTGTNAVSVEEVGFLRLYNINAARFTNDGVLVPVAGNIVIDNSKFSDNGVNGLEVSNSSARVYVHNSGFDHNGNDGVLVSAGKATVGNSYANYNMIGFEANDSGNLTLTQDHAIFNATGISATSAAAIMNFAYCTLSMNTTADWFANASNTTFNGSYPQTTLGPEQNQEAPTIYLH